VCKIEGCTREANQKQGYCYPCHYKHQQELTAKRRVSQEMKKSLAQMRRQVIWMKEKDLLPKKGPEKSRGKGHHGAEQ
jgi:hypothetical protein